MPTLASSIPAGVADVVWWSSQQVYIRCPNCEEIHFHGFSSYENTLRMPHCERSRQPSYRFRFPDAFEIDKKEARFVNIFDRQYLKKEKEDSHETESSLLEEFSNMRLSRQDEISFDSSFERIDGPSYPEGRRILFALSDCVCGDVPEVQKYLEESPDRNIFLHGNDNRGNTCLIMASCERNSAMVSLLIDNGAEVNAKNNDGRTALMEASLWGRLKIVELLLSRGADKDLRDGIKNTAFDLAQPTRQNQKERYTRSGGSIRYQFEGMYKEDTYMRDEDRLDIARILKGPESSSRINEQQRPWVSDTRDHLLMRSPDGQTVIQYAPVAEYPISRPSKTIALLRRGYPFPDIAAMSGWIHSESQESQSEQMSIRVSGEEWTQRVLEIAAAVGHTLSVSYQADQGVSGQFQASHAEKQLIAYFLDRHVFLEEDKTPHPHFREKIEHLEYEIECMEDDPNIERLYNIRQEKQTLARELFEIDEPLDNEDLVESKKAKIADLDRQGLDLSTLREVKKVQALEYQIQKCEDDAKIHGHLEPLSRITPGNALTQAVILINTPKCEICSDCMLFKDKVNQAFNLSIELRASNS